MRLFLRLNKSCLTMFKCFTCNMNNILIIFTRIKVTSQKSSASHDSLIINFYSEKIKLKV
ncbi:hypothetical protein BpHYR1_024583 [Brachionus plicatilis]|uniref:Uncharacterized protein n=1 Tax=Brachionus plicatilis TaxID=10195 RepID=A0A3M7R038_BRAPC|nr:hypothetical protein BpHYR1_024583 [Brachionus plicatilis]